MATNWGIETKTKTSTTDNWDVRGIGSVSIGPRWEDMPTTNDWEDLTGHYWGWTKSWTISNTATTRDSD